MTAPNVDPDDDTGPDNPNPQPPAPGDDGPLLKEDGSQFTRADLDALNAALTKARRDARAAKRGRPADKPDSADPTDVDKAVADATAAADGRWKPMVVRTAARAAFIEAGLVLPKNNADAAMRRVLKLLDVDDLDIGDDGQVEGLREQVDEIKADWPDLFASTRSRPGKVDGADRGSQGSGKPKTASEIQAAQLLGSTR